MEVDQQSSQQDEHRRKFTSEIAQLETILHEFERLQRGIFSESVEAEITQLKAEASRKIETLENYRLEQLKLYEKEYECQVQCAKDEYEVFELLNKPSITPNPNQTL